MLLTNSSAFNSCFYLLSFVQFISFIAYLCPALVTWGVSISDSTEGSTLASQVWLLGLCIHRSAVISFLRFLLSTNGPKLLRYHVANTSYKRCRLQYSQRVLPSVLSLGQWPHDDSGCRVRPILFRRHSVFCPSIFLCLRIVTSLGILASHYCTRLS